MPKKTKNGHLSLARRAIGSQRYQICWCARAWKSSHLIILTANASSRKRLGSIPRSITHGDIRDRKRSLPADKTMSSFTKRLTAATCPKFRIRSVNSLGKPKCARSFVRKICGFKKFVVASSASRYSEGAGICPKHSASFFRTCGGRTMRKGDWEVQLPDLRRGSPKSAAHSENCAVAAKRFMV